ncbi:MAG: LuxR C-terminal-related transcriptional regulator, partial [Candidatus Sericytochromatia bacterium]
LALMQQESWQQAEDAFHQAARWNRQAGNLITHFAARVCQARLFLHQGDLDTAKRAYTDILASGRQEALQRHSLFGVVQVDLARIAYEQDEMEACQALLTDGLALTRLSYNLDSVYGFVNALQILLDARELKQADALLHEAMQFAQTRHLESLWQSLQTLRERLDIFRGKLHKTETGDAWNALYAALAARDPDKAQRLLEPLLTQHQEHRLQRVRLEMLQARLLELKGEATAARQQLLQALETAQRAPSFRALLDEASPGLLAWMPSLLAGLRPGFRARLLESLASRGFQPEAEALSERERELLVCLADGLNNKQMEEKLFISQNTIKTHLKNLYRKLGVGSRTAAIARAREQGWL